MAHLPVTATLLRSRLWRGSQYPGNPSAADQYVQRESITAYATDGWCARTDLGLRLAGAKRSPIAGGLLARAGCVESSATRRQLQVTASDIVLGENQCAAMNAGAL